TRSWLADLWDEKPTFVYEGEVKRIRTASQRIDVGDRTFDYDDDTVFLVNNEEDPSADINDVSVDDLVQVTYVGNYAEEINVLTYQIEDGEFEGVETDEGETDFGEIEVNGATIEITDDTVILLDGK